MQDLPAFNARLQEWHGVRAEVWDYTVGHAIMRVHLSRGTNSPSAVLYMFACRRVSFSPHWRKSALSVTRLPADREIYLVTDNSDLRVECENVHFSAPLSSYSDIPSSPQDSPP